MQNKYCQNCRENTNAGRATGGSMNNPEIPDS